MRVDASAPVRECRDHGDTSCQANSDKLRRYFWGEENELNAVIDGGGWNVTRFMYDAGGQRVVKLGRGGESITVGQFFALKGRKAATKHVFIGETRVASKLLPSPGWEPSWSEGTTVSGPIVDGTTVETVNGCNPSTYQPQKCPIDPAANPVIDRRPDTTQIKPATYYYHSDHLGSTSWVTDQNGRVHEHVEYFPYGEVWRDARYDSDGDPVHRQQFLFSAKELDEETGLYYFGARYLDPVRARWLSSDPILSELMSENPRDLSRNLSLYSYVLNSPLSYVDPDGRDAVILHGGLGGVAAGVEELGKTVGGLYTTPITEYRPEINYTNWSIKNDTPGTGMEIAEKHKHAGEPRILAGYSIGGDAALGAGASDGGKNWDLGVAAGARVDSDFMSKVEAAAKNSNMLILVGIRGDKDMANESGVPGWIGRRFGDRSYEAIVAAISAKHGSLAAFYKAFPNVSVQASSGAHGGGGNRPATQEAVRNGFKELQARTRSLGACH